MANDTEVTDEQILSELQDFSDAGLIDYVLPTEPLGVQWIVGWAGQILKFVTKEGIVGFLAGIKVCAVFVGKIKTADAAPIWEHPTWTAANQRDNLAATLKKMAVTPTDLTEVLSGLEVCVEAGGSLVSGTLNEPGKVAGDILRGLPQPAVRVAAKGTGRD